MMAVVGGCGGWLRLTVQVEKMIEMFERNRSRV